MAVVADAGYKNERRVSRRSRPECAVTAYVSLGREGKAPAVLNPAAPATGRMAARLRHAGRAGDLSPSQSDRRTGPRLDQRGAFGFRRFSLRGEANSRGEWQLVCLAVNVKRCHRIRMA